LPAPVSSTGNPEYAGANVGHPSSSSRPFDASDLSNPSIPTKPLIPQISDISILGSPYPSDSEL
jgi:hypothetical protein